MNTFGCVKHLNNWAALDTYEQLENIHIERYNKGQYILLTTHRLHRHHQAPYSSGRWHHCRRPHHPQQQLG